jgi:hypothetical protein
LADIGAPHHILGPKKVAAHGACIRTNNSADEISLAVRAVGRGASEEGARPAGHGSELNSGISVLWQARDVT